MPDTLHQPQQHCRSYYAATRNDMTEYPPLAGDCRADVCVIGGGFTGVATALSLAEQGVSVVLLEQHRIGWGASGRNGGQMINGISGDEKMLARLGDHLEEALVKLGFRGNEIIADRVQRYGIACDLHHGYLDVAIKDRHLRDFEAYYQLLDKYGYADQAVLLDRTGVRQLLATDAYIGGLRNDRNGHLHPLNLCLGEARAASALGVQIHECTEVLEIAHGAPATVITRQGRVTADKVVLATNAYNLLEQERLPAQIFPAGSFMIATEPLSEAEARQINPEKLAVCDPNVVLDYFRLTLDRRMLFGGRCNYSGRVPKSIAATMQPRLNRIFPQLASKRIDYEWGGNIAIVLNRIPLLGRTAPNVYYAMGYCGHGVNASHIAAELIAKAMTGDDQPLQWFEQIRHYRIPFGQRLGSQLVALGMLYYRLLDQL